MEFQTMTDQEIRKFCDRVGLITMPKAGRVKITKSGAKLVEFYYGELGWSGVSYEPPSEEE